MSKAAVIQKLEKAQMKKNIPDFRIGDTIRIHTRIVEGEKERTQMFTGTVIARKGTGLSETFSLHRVAYGEGMERVFPLHSPRITKIEIIKRGRVRRGKLYYLRGTSGRAAKVQGRIESVKKVRTYIEQTQSETENQDASEVVGTAAPVEAANTQE